MDIAQFDPNVLHIFSKEVLAKIRNGEPGWEHSVSPKVAGLIKEKYLFGFPQEQMKFDY